MAAARGMARPGGAGLRRLRRLPVPDEVLALVEADALGEAEERLHAFVMARVPPAATGVRMRLDAERLEVVLSWGLGARPRRRVAPVRAE